MMDRRIFGWLALAGLLLVSPAPREAWRWTDEALVRAPAAARVVAPVVEADFDGDGVTERLALEAGRARLLNGARLRWESPQEWQVRQAAIADLNYDGQPEAVLLVWRPFRSWPVDRWLPSKGRIAGFQDANGHSCQIILIGWGRGIFRERWAGSALAQPLKSFALADLRGNGRPLLLGLEAEYNDAPGAAARRIKVWEWNGFGFSLVYKMEGPIGGMALFQNGAGQAWVLAP